MSWLEGLVGLAGSLWGASESADASDDAAQAQVDAANRQYSLYKKQMKQTRKDLKPWMNMGKSSVGMLNRMMGFKGGLPATPASGVNDWGQYFDASKASQDRIPAMINTQEAALLKANGGAGVQNPQTGMWHFYETDPDNDTWSRNYEAMGKAAEAWNKERPTLERAGWSGKDLFGGFGNAARKVGGYIRDYQNWEKSAPYGSKAPSRGGNFARGADGRAGLGYAGSSGFADAGGGWTPPWLQYKAPTGYEVTGYGQGLQTPGIAGTNDAIYIGKKQKPQTQANGTAAAATTTTDPWAGYFMSDFGPQDLLKDPSYQFRMDEARRALEANAAAKGTLGSGGYIKDLNALTQNLASTEYGNAWNRWSGTMGDRFNRLAALSGMGQTAASQVGNSGLNYAGMMGNAYGDIGNANAAGRIGSSNAWVGGINNAINSWWG